MIAIALVIISSIPTISIPVKAEASVDGKLITVGGKTVTKNMKIDDVKKMFGEPKLTTIILGWICLYILRKRL